MKTLFTFGTFVCVVLLAPWPAAAVSKEQPPAPSEPVAVVNGTVITVAQVQEVIREAPAGIGGMLQKRKLGLVKELVNRELIYQDALSKGLDKDKEVASLSEPQRRWAVIERYLRPRVKGLAPTDTDVRDYYKAHAAEFTSPEQVRVSQILLSNPADADLVARKIRNKEPFDRLAAYYSVAASKKARGDIGYVTRGKLDPALDAAAFALKTGEVSAPVKTKYGYHILKVTDRRPAVTKPLEDVSEAVRMKLRLEKTQEAVDEVAAELKGQAAVEIREDIIDRIE